MNADPHQIFHRIIDKTLAGATSAQEEKSLREHLRNCAQCQEYLRRGNRVTASLGGFSFDVNPELHAKVCASLEQRARQLEARQLSRRRMAWSCIAALMLTAAGSLIASLFGDRAAAVFDVQPMQVQRGLLAFWVVPSLCFSMLLPMLPQLAAIWTNRKGRVL